MNETKYIIYKITNLINEKIYIGCHKCTDINDDYMGSGKHLKYAQNKYGIENFSKEILEVFDNPEEMFNIESQLVNEEFIDREDVYNLRLGGSGGWDYINENPTEECLKAWRKSYAKAAEVGRQTQKWLRENDTEWFNTFKENVSLSITKFYEEGGVNGFIGLSHSEETKDQMKETHKKNKHQQGEKNSMFGKIWIYNLNEKVSKRIEKEELPEYENLGWLKGRKMKF